MGKCKVQEQKIMLLNTLNVKPAITNFWPQKQAKYNVNIERYYDLLSCYGELASKQLPIYTSSRYGETLSFVRSCISITCRMLFQSSTMFTR